MDMRHSNVRFPIERIEDEFNRDHASFKDLLKALMVKLVSQNPQLLSLRIHGLNSVTINFELGRFPPKGALLEYLLSLQRHIEEEMCTAFATQIGRHISVDELKGVLTVSQSDYQIAFDIMENYKTKLVKDTHNSMLEMVNRCIPETQETRPDIEIGIVHRDVGGTRKKLYIESQGRILEDRVFKLRSVTLDTSVLMEWWKEQEKIEVVETLLDMGKDFEIDLAVTNRIRDDIPNPPLAIRINELTSIDVQELGAVIRIGHWNVGVDVVGDTEFREFADSNEVQQKILYLLETKQINSEPDWRDWDHVHTHYRYKRDVFLTWDKGILAFAEEFKSRFGIQVMKPQDFLSESLVQSSES